MIIPKSNTVIYVTKFYFNTNAYAYFIIYKEILRKLQINYKMSQLYKNVTTTHCILSTYSVLFIGISIFLRRLDRQKPSLAV